MKKSSAGVYFFGLGALILVALVGIKIYQNYVQVTPPGFYNDFTQCLTGKKVKMYGAWWCSHCENQKKLFGDAFKYVDYVECSPLGSKELSSECKTRGIKGVPVWEFADGSRQEGEVPLEELARLSGCELPLPK